MQKEESIFMRELSKGSRSAFDWLFIRYQPKVVAFLKACTGDEEQARDMAQDIFSIYGKTGKSSPGSDRSMDISFRWPDLPSIIISII